MNDKTDEQILAEVFLEELAKLDRFLEQFDQQIKHLIAKYNHDWRTTPAEKIRS